MSQNVFQRINCRVLREQDASRVCHAIPAVISREEIDEAARLAS